MLGTLLKSFSPGNISTGIPLCFWRCVESGGYRRVYRLSVCPRADYVDVIVEFDANGPHPISAEICGWSEKWKLSDWPDLEEFLLDRSDRDKDYHLQWEDHHASNITEALRSHVRRL